MCQRITLTQAQHPDPARFGHQLSHFFNAARTVRFQRGQGVLNLRLDDAMKNIIRIVLRRGILKHGLDNLAAVGFDGIDDQFTEFVLEAVKADKSDLSCDSGYRRRANAIAIGDLSDCRHCRPVGIIDHGQENFVTAFAEVNFAGSTHEMQTQLLNVIRFHVWIYHAG